MGEPTRNLGYWEGRVEWFYLLGSMQLWFRLGSGGTSQCTVESSNQVRRHRAAPSPARGGQRNRFNC